MPRLASRPQACWSNQSLIFAMTSAMASSSVRWPLNFVSAMDTLQQPHCTKDARAFPKLWPELVTFQLFTNHGAVHGVWTHPHSLPMVIDVSRSEGKRHAFSSPPSSVGGLDLDSRNSGCARLGCEVGPLGVLFPCFFFWL